MRPESIEPLTQADVHNLFDALKRTKKLKSTVCDTICSLFRIKSKSEALRLRQKKVDKF